MLAALSPAADNYEETLSTLRYANRAKNIKNKPTINEDPKDAMLRQLQEEIEALKAQLLGQGPGVTGDSNAFVVSQDQIEEEKRKLREEFEEKIKEIKEQYEEEKLSKESLQKNMESIQAQYDSQLVLLNADPVKRSKASLDKEQKKSKESKSKKLAATAIVNNNLGNSLNAMVSNLDGNQINGIDTGSNKNSPRDMIISDLNEDEERDPAQRLLKLQNMVVGGEQANNEELKTKRIKKKKYAEERKQLLAESLRKGDDEEFMLRVYDR